MGPLLAFSALAALFGGGAGALAWYRTNYGDLAPSNATSPTADGGAAAGAGLVPLGNTGLLTSLDNPYTGYVAPNGSLSFSSYVDPTSGATVVEQAATPSTQPLGGLNGGKAATGFGGFALSGLAAPAAKSPSASGLAAMQSVEANASHLIGGLP